MLGGSASGPYYSSTPEVEALNFQLQDYQNNVCTFLAQSVIVQTTNPAHTAPPQVKIRSATMSKMKMDLAGGYWKSQDFYFGRDFWDVGLRNMQNSDNTRAYVCGVMRNECAEYLPEGESTNCTERLQDLPFLTMSPVDETVFSSSRILKLVAPFTRRLPSPIPRSTVPTFLSSHWQTQRAKLSVRTIRDHCIGIRIYLPMKTLLVLKLSWSSRVLIQNQGSSTYS